jgi:hypothetical protein
VRSRNPITSDGYGATTWHNIGTQTPAQLGAQASLVSVLQNRGLVDRAAKAAHFITLDDTESAPITFFTCADMGM